MGRVCLLESVDTSLGHMIARQDTYMRDATVLAHHPTTVNIGCGLSYRDVHIEGYNIYICVSDRCVDDGSSVLASRS